MTVDRGNEKGGLGANLHCCTDLWEIPDPTSKTGAKGGAGVGVVGAEPRGKRQWWRWAPLRR